MSGNDYVLRHLRAQVNQQRALAHDDAEDEELYASLALRARERLAERETAIAHLEEAIKQLSREAK